MCSLISTDLFWTLIATYATMYDVDHSFAFWVTGSAVNLRFLICIWDPVIVVWPGCPVCMETEDLFPEVNKSLLVQEWFLFIRSQQRKMYIDWRDLCHNTTYVRVHFSTEHRRTTYTALIGFLRKSTVLSTYFWRFWWQMIKPLSLNFVCPFTSHLASRWLVKGWLLNHVYIFWHFNTTSQVTYRLHNSVVAVTLLFVLKLP